MPSWSSGEISDEDIEKNWKLFTFWLLKEIDHEKHNYGYSDAYFFGCTIL